MESLAKFRPDVPHAPDTFAIIVEVRLPGNLGSALEQRIACGVPEAQFQAALLYCSHTRVIIGTVSWQLSLKDSLGRAWHEAATWRPCAVAAYLGDETFGAWLLPRLRPAS